MSTPAESDSWERSVYLQLHRLATRAFSREPTGHSLQPTVLVNDAFMLLLEQKNIDHSDRPRVLAAGAVIIRRLLVDHARRRRAQKRGGGTGRGQEIRSTVEDPTRPFDALDVADALEVLSEESPRVARVVELRFFGGLTGEEIADFLSVSPKTVANDWRYARAWLGQKLSHDEDRDGVG